MQKLSKEQEILKMLFKDREGYYNSRSISKKIGMSHAGAFKILKKLESREIVKPRRVGKAVIYSINFDNPIAFREIELALTIEAQEYNRWIEELRGLKKEVKFIILFGSILRNEKEARDIDILIVREDSNIKVIKKIIQSRNELSNKKIHPIIQSQEDFKKDFSSKNRVMSEILRTGIVLFGQENLTKLMQEQ